MKYKVDKISKISILTPCFNSEDLIEETIQSVLNQTIIKSGQLKLQYIICDGGSTDHTLSKVKSFNHPAIQIISEIDNGMYDALAKGLSIANGDIMAYINAGDFYSLTAFEVVTEIMTKNQASWLTGLTVYYNEKSVITSFELPFKYRRRFILAGIYGSILPYIQQESTFWRAELTDLIDLQKLAKYKLAGDYFIWHCFAQKYRLFIVEAYLGGFKRHRGQLTGNIKPYKKEMKKIISRSFFLIVLSILDIILWKCPNRIKKIFNQDGVFRYNHRIQEWN